MKKRHPFYEDVISIFCGTLFVALGIILIHHNALLPPGTVGLALVLESLLHVNFGLVFFLINLPFYILSYQQLGKEFTIKTFIAVTGVSALVHYIPDAITITQVSTSFSVVVGGIMLGLGVLFMFRHGGSLGGIGILAFYVQKRWGIRAGKFQMPIDVAIVCSAYFLADLTILLYSIATAIALNLIIALNHKEGRYQIT